MIDDLLKKSIDGEDLTADELGTLFDVPLFSEESAKIIATSRVKSERACNGHAEIHAQIGLNIAPCSMNCKFCSFAEESLHESISLSSETGLAAVPIVSRPSIVRTTFGCRA